MNMNKEKAMDKEKFEIKENKYFEEDKEYVFKASTGIFKSKVKKGRNSFFYTLTDGINESNRGIFKASSILVKVN